MKVVRLIVDLGSDKFSVFNVKWKEDIPRFEAVNSQLTRHFENNWNGYVILDNDYGRNN